MTIEQSEKQPPQQEEWRGRKILNRFMSVFKSQRSAEGPTVIDLRSGQSEENEEEREKTVFQILNAAGLNINGSDLSDELAEKFMDLYDFSKLSLKTEMSVEDARLYGELHLFYDILRMYDLSSEGIKKLDDDQRKTIYRTLGRFLNLLEIYAKDKKTNTKEAIVIFMEVEDHLSDLIRLNEEDVTRWLEELDDQAEEDPDIVFLAATVRGGEAFHGNKENSFFTKREEKFGVAADEHRGLVIVEPGRFVLQKVDHLDDGSEVLGLPRLDMEEFNDEKAYMSVYPQAKYMRQEAHITLLKSGEVDYDPEQDVYGWDQIEEMVKNGDLTDT
jgi:hypothetical protein